jgi:fructose/tagatose bisphosphate aldolase
MKDLLVKAKAEGYAVGAFSIVDYATLVNECARGL